MRAKKVGKTNTLRLILGDQLNPLHSWFTAVDDSVIYVLMELHQETDYVLHHAQKILAIFAGMRDFAAHATAVRAVFHLVPHLLPLFTPHERALAVDADFAGQIGFFDHFHF